MGTRTKLLATLALAGGCALLAVPSIAAATPSGVTIHHIGHHFLFGYVFNDEPARWPPGTIPAARTLGRKEIA